MHNVYVKKFLIAPKNKNKIKTRTKVHIKLDTKCINKIHSIVIYNNNNFTYCIVRSLKFLFLNSTLFEEKYLSLLDPNYSLRGRVDTNSLILSTSPYITSELNKELYRNLNLQKNRGAIEIPLATVGYHCIICNFIFYIPILSSYKSSGDSIWEITDGVPIPNKMIIILHKSLQYEGIFILTSSGQKGLK